MEETMSSDPTQPGGFPAAAEPPLEAAPAPPSVVRKIFFGPNGLRAGWRLLIFLALVAALQFLVVQKFLRVFPAVVKLVQEAQAGGVLSPEFQFIFEASGIFVVFVAAAIMSRIEKRRFGVYGIPLQGAFGKLFWLGALWGFAYETVEMLAIWACGGYSFGTLALVGKSLVSYAVLWAIGFVMVGIFEEFLFRGYAQYTLGSGIGFWASAFLLSAAFGAIHLNNQGEGWVGALSVFTFGIFGCLVLRRTGNLWFIIGFHAATDYAETFVYSTPDSGLLARGHLLNSTFHGPTWLTGGMIGPEGSVFAFVVFAIFFLAFSRAYAAKADSSAAAF
jgi:membrane protease YdiL (CAAX protease family)